ncbi:MAG TPA: hypothetical protein VFR94_08410 [Nitrososphaeraceae archaeon]|nr:hypothetical protein [Nitrososphaeraceae archaeon]
MKTNTTLVVLAIMASLGLVTVVAVDVMLTVQEIHADKPPVKGCTRSIAANASQGRCVQPAVQSADEQTVEVQVESEENADEEGEEGEENEGEDDQDEEEDEK